jgi:hypothetical protein
MLLLITDTIFLFFVTEDQVIRAPEKSQDKKFQKILAKLRPSDQSRFKKVILTENNHFILVVCHSGVTGGIPCPKCPNLANWYD